MPITTQHLNISTEMIRQSHHSQSLSNITPEKNTVKCVDQCWEKKNMENILKQGNVTFLHVSFWHELPLMVNYGWYKIPDYTSQCDKSAWMFAVQLLFLSYTYRNVIGRVQQRATSEFTYKSTAQLKAEYIIDTQD